MILPISPNIAGIALIAAMKTLPITSAILIKTGANSSMAFMRTLPITSAILIKTGASASNAGAAILNAAPKPIIPTVNTAKPAMVNGFANDAIPLAKLLRNTSNPFPANFKSTPMPLPSAPNPAPSFASIPPPMSPPPSSPAPPPAPPPDILSAIFCNRSICLSEAAFASAFALSRSAGDSPSPLCSTLIISSSSVMEFAAAVRGVSADPAPSSTVGPASPIVCASAIICASCSALSALIRIAACSSPSVAVRAASLAFR